MTEREGAEMTVSLTRKCLNLRGTGPKPDLVPAHREWVTHTQGPRQHSRSATTESREHQPEWGHGEEKNRPGSSGKLEETEDTSLTRDES